MKNILLIAFTPLIFALSTYAEEISVICENDSHPRLTATNLRIAAIDFGRLAGTFAVSVQMKSMQRGIGLEQYITPSDGVCFITAPTEIEISCANDFSPRARFKNLRLAELSDSIDGIFVVSGQFSGATKGVDLSSLVSPDDGVCFVRPGAN